MPHPQRGQRIQNGIMHRRQHGHRPGLARVLSLPPGRDSHHSNILSSYRAHQGVLHNPRSDRRTTSGIFHVTEGGLPIPDDKKAVPAAVFGRQLQHAFNPPVEFLRLPFTAAEPAPVAPAGAPSVPVAATPPLIDQNAAAAAALADGSASVRFTPTRPGTPVAGALQSEKVADVTPATTYVVRPGDSLWSIAKKHKLTVGDLTAANGIAANANLQPGKKLVIPAKSGAVAAPRPPRRPRRPSRAGRPRPPRPSRGWRACVTW